jgi:hypothetical protein
VDVRRSEEFSEGAREGPRGGRIQGTEADSCARPAINAQIFTGGRRFYFTILLDKLLRDGQDSATLVLSAY